MPILDPNTRRRLRRFKEIGRARWSFRILLGILIVSLLSNFVANDTPLVVKSNGKTYFPVLRFWSDHTEKTILGEGSDSRAKYKALEKMPHFSENKSNWMLWPPIKFGSFESLSSGEVERAFAVEIRILPTVRVGSLDIDSENSVARSRGGEVFFGGEKSDRELTGEPLGIFGEIPEGALEAIKIRFENQPAPAAIFPIKTESDAIELSFSEFKPRSRPPRTVRASVRDADVSSAKTQKLKLNEDFTVKGNAPKLWSEFDDATKQKVREAFESIQNQAADKETEAKIETNVGPKTLKLKIEEVSFPYRPTKNHPLGLDESGRDVLVQILYATRISLLFGLLLVLSTFIVGIFCGAVQGYFGGITDLVGQRLTEIWESMPFLLIMILVSSIYGRSFTLLLILFAIFNWIGISYYIRGEFLRLRKQQFVEAARVMGIGRWKIMFRHMLPNGLVPIITIFPFSLVGAIGVLSSLDFLGFGLPAGTPSWGNMIYQGRTAPYAWWLVLYPCIALFVVSLLGVFIGEGLRAAFDPKTKSRIE